MTIELDTDINNLADRAAAKADSAVESTRDTANAALDGLSDTVENLRSKVSPTIDRINAPFDEVIAYTHAKPLTALLLAGSAGAALMALISLIRR